MIRATLTLEGTAEELRSILERLPELATRDAHVEQNMEPGWTKDTVSRVWRGLQPKAKMVLAEVATKDGGYSREELRGKLGLDGKQIGARLSSLGHQLRRQGFRNVLPYPLTYDHGGGYWLDAVWREFISEQ